MQWAWPTAYNTMAEYWSNEDFEFTVAEASVAGAEAPSVLLAPGRQHRQVGEATSTTLSDHDRALLGEMQHRRCSCYWCLLTYFEIENIGEWRCRAHLDDFVGGRWQCCKKTTRAARGCVRTHHSPVPTVHVREPLQLSLPLCAQVRPWLSADTMLLVSEQLGDGAEGAAAPPIAYVAAVARFSQDDVNIVQATECDADELRRQHRLDSYGYSRHVGASVRDFRVPQSRQEMHALMQALNMPRRYWGGACGGACGPPNPPLF